MMQDSSVEDTYFGSISSIRIGDKLLDLSIPVVMGILNVTPDSFYAESREKSTNSAFDKAKEMINAGAMVIDVGGYSTRPGADEISIDEEVSRVVPIIQSIRGEFPGIAISIDTFRSKVAEEAILAGANIINDVSGFEIDPDIIHIAAKYKVPYVLMHMRGNPKTMQSLTEYANLFKDISFYFSSKIEKLKAAGVNDIILDPGFGFAKTIEQNHDLLRHLEAFHLFEKPILAGLSRKSMIYKKLGITPEESLNGTIALNAIALQKGAKILRVHDVKEAAQLISLLK
ncbi:MAG: dihydropteroate synthase [Crocinitomicaceae bacterium]|nr:dihydropteroate synthase [Crocinitomicaceae bacterium]